MRAVYMPSDDLGHDEPGAVANHEQTNGVANKKEACHDCQRLREAGGA
jgi:hypothetical protein